MSTSQPLRTVSGRVKGKLPENGYESPRSPENEEPFLNGIGNGTPKVGERRRAGRSGQTFVAFQSPETLDHIGIGRSDADSGREEDTNSRKVGIRDRVGCYTWTWFTMTMATGGIANVLHSSSRP
jgi:hypothetical protein